MLTSLVESEKQKKISDGSSFLTRRAKPDSRSGRLREMPFAVKAHGCPTAIFLFSVFLTFAQALPHSYKEFRVTFAESDISESESANVTSENARLADKLLSSLLCIFSASRSRSLVQ